MNGTDELERRITQGLRDHSRLAPDRDGWEAILDRIEHRGRARDRRRAAATGLVVVGMVAMVGSLVVLTGSDHTRVSTTPAPPVAGAPGMASAATSGSLPRLLLGAAGFEVTYAAESEPGAPAPDLGRLLVYTAPGEGLLADGAVVFAQLVPAGASYGIGDGPDVTPVDVAGRPGRLMSMGSPVVSLGWSRADGSLVHLIAVDVTPGALVAAGQAVETHMALGQDPPAALPGGIELRRSTRWEGSQSGQTEVSYRSGDRTVDLRLTGGGAYRLDSLVLDRLASSTRWRPATVAGRPAVLATYQESDDTALQARTLMWAVADGVVAELTAQGLTEAEVEAAAASLRPVDEAGWDGLVAEFAVRSSGTSEAQLGDQVSEAMTAICHLRERWLTAHAAGVAGAEVKAAVVAELGNVLDKSRAAGLGESGDILVVAVRLLDAMAAGDEPTVSSVPAGGACS